MSERISTSLGELPIRKAALADLPAIVEILREAQDWMNARGLAQWVPGAHDPTLVDAMLREEIVYGVIDEKPSAKTVDQAVDGKRIIATIALKQSLPAHWTPRTEPFGYVSTLHVARAYAGAGIGAALVAWGEAALREAGKVWACLDCYGKNDALCAYYTALGYQPLGEAETYPGYPERMMEKNLKTGLRTED